MAQKNRKQLTNFIFESAGCSLLRAEGFFLELWRPLWRPMDKYSKLQFLIKKEKNFSCTFFHLWSSKPYIRIRIHLKC
jgi:hypothetical protein